MIALNSGQSLEMVLAGAKTSLDCPFVANWQDVPNAGGIGGTPPIAFPSSTNGNTNGVTKVTIVPAPTAGGTTRQVNAISLFNIDTGAITPTLQLNDNGTVRVITTESLQIGETFLYETADGFKCIDTNGNIKTNQPASSAAASTANSVAVQASSTGSSIAAFNPASTSSQASSMAALSPASVSSQASIATANNPASTSSQASSMAALTPASVSSQASSAAALNPATVSQQQSGASSLAFTSTNWSTASSTVSRVKSSFTW